MNELKDSIAGNLCRCTGYKPIIKAAKSLKNKNKNDHFSKTKKYNKFIKENNNKSIKIYKKDKIYFAPRYIQEVKKILKKNII